jgi:hypothetical protein
MHGGSTHFSRRKRGVRICPDNRFSGFGFDSLLEQLESASNTIPQKKLAKLASGEIELKGE